MKPKLYPLGTLLTTPYPGHGQYYYHLKVWHCWMYWEVGWRDMNENKQLAGSQVAYEILFREWLMIIRELVTEVTVTFVREMESKTSSPWLYPAWNITFHNYNYYTQRSTYIIKWETFIFYFWTPCLQCYWLWLGRRTLLFELWNVAISKHKNLIKSNSNFVNKFWW